MRGEEDACPSAACDQAPAHMQYAQPASMQPRQPSSSNSPAVVSASEPVQHHASFIRSLGMPVEPPCPINLPPPALHMRTLAAAQQHVELSCLAAPDADSDGSSSSDASSNDGLSPRAPSAEGAEKEGTDLGDEAAGLSLCDRVAGASSSGMGGSEQQQQRGSSGTFEVFQVEQPEDTELKVLRRTLEKKVGAEGAVRQGEGRQHAGKALTAVLCAPPPPPAGRRLCTSQSRPALLTGPPRLLNPCLQVEECEHLRSVISQLAQNRHKLQRSKVSQGQRYLLRVVGCTP